MTKAKPTLKLNVDPGEHGRDYEKEEDLYEHARDLARSWKRDVVVKWTDTGVEKVFPYDEP